MRDASEGVPVWYVLDESKTVADGFVIYEPTQGKPWTWRGGQEVADKLLKRAPQATRVWFIGDDAARGVTA